MPFDEKRVREIVMDRLGVSEDQITPGASFVNDLGADSLDTVELIMALEEEFKIDIADDDAEKLLTVGDATSYIESWVKLRELLAAVLGVSEDQVGGESKMAELGVSGAKLGELVQALNKEFKTELSDEEVGKLESVKDLFGYLREHVAA